MSQPMIMWCVIAGGLLCIFLFRAVGRYCAAHKPCRLLGIAKDKALLYMPGDMDDEDDFDDM